MEQSTRDKLLTVTKEVEGFMKESVPSRLENGVHKEYGGHLVCFDAPRTADQGTGCINA